jgi:cephalosporin hydroxylase
MGYRIAGRVDPKKDLTKVPDESQFARSIRQLFRQIRPRRVIETGTYHGNGSTAVIASALQQYGSENASFYSIEVNPKFHQWAISNLAKRGLSVAVLNGLSVPRRMLPTIQQIERQYVTDVEADDVFVDHEEADRAIRYFSETDFPNANDDLLGVCLADFEYRPDFVLLDSGGHMGHVEFLYLLPLLRDTCYIALDDIYHVKHHQSFKQVQSDPRFELVAVSEEKFGFCIARFTPNTARG